MYEFREYLPSIAASNDRIVSRGLSHRLRVGLFRSGSAVKISAFSPASATEVSRTDRVSMNIEMLNSSNRC
jgi:hypothetical protein